MIEVEDLAELELINPALPVFFGDSPFFDRSYPDPAFLVMPVDEDLLPRLSPNFLLVASSKKHATILKKLNFPVERHDISPSAVLKTYGLTRQSMSLASLKKTYEQVQVAKKVALLGESKESLQYAMSDFDGLDGFGFQEAFLQCNLPRSLAHVRTMAASGVVGAAALLLSGHTMAFMIQGSSVRDVVAGGFNSFCVNKIHGFSGAYTRRVDYDRATRLLTEVLPRIKEGEEPLHLLRRVVTGVLIRA